MHEEVEVEENEGPEMALLTVTENDKQTSKVSDIMNMLNEKSCELWTTLIEFMNSDQLRIFNSITQKLEHQIKHTKKECECTFNETINMMISGVGGTGKSFLIKALKLWIQQETNAMAIITAPTGLAAHNIGGITIHRLLYLPIEHGKSTTYEPLTDESLAMLRSALSKLESGLLIIDEVSMVSNIQFLFIHLRLQEIFGVENFFGGINVVLFGDCLQLPPVHEKPIYKILPQEKVLKLAGSLGSFHAWSHFKYDELTINMRQKRFRLCTDFK